MSEELYQWPSVQVDPNVGTVSKVNTLTDTIGLIITAAGSDERLEALLSGAPVDADTIIELLAKMGTDIATATSGLAVAATVTTDIATAVSTAISPLATEANYRAITATTTAVAGDYIMVDATSAYDIVIPAAGAIGEKIKLVVTGVSAITLSSGFVSAGVAADSEFTLISNGTAWVQG